MKKEGCSQAAAVGALSAAGVLASTYRALASSSSGQPPQPVAATLPLSELCAAGGLTGGTQTEHRLACAACETGSLGYLLYLPKGYESSHQQW
jgi:hypothetical protein